MIAILDYEAGNQTSVRRALDRLGIASVVSADAKDIYRCDGLIFPGVGAAGQAMNILRQSGLDLLLKNWVQEGRPLLGVCLGCQILLEHSEENDIETLGILPGRTKVFSEELTEEDGNRIAIPHMGWNGLHRHQDCLLFDGVPKNAEFYFVHSYYVEVDPSLVIATTRYGLEFCSFFGHEGLWAAQFHIEKSGQAGLKVLQNYCRYCAQHAAGGRGGQGA